MRKLKNSNRIKRQKTNKWMKKKKKVNIIYIMPAHKSASGGSKVIYQHSELINKFKIIII